MLLEFYGKECPHCVNMEPTVAKVEKATGLKFQKFEVWHNEENAQKLNTHDRGRCGGVPFYINTDTDKFICGEDSYEALKALAEGK
ncbi:MAG: hypothetical protein KGI60_03000 [Patescibacteria group bacterium]|nr:hypothetical protein [Patescibacteria group bacterium]